VFRYCKITFFFSRNKLLSVEIMLRHIAGICSRVIVPFEKSYEKRHFTWKDGVSTVKLTIEL